MFISSHARWYRLFQDIPTDGLRASDGKNLLEELRYWPGAYNLALMELFGLVEVSIGQLIEGEGWQISQIRRTEYGDAILAAVTTSSDEVDPFIFADNFIPPPLGSWQPRLQPYFPQWKKNLENKEEGYRAGLHIFTVALDSEVWRRLAVPAECSLEDLATAIRNAYGFDNDHLYQFIVETVSGHRHYVFHPYMDDEPATTDVKVGEIPLREGKSMLFNYDFGDNWNFDVRLECVDENDTHSATTSVLEKRGESPEQYLDYDGHWE